MAMIHSSTTEGGVVRMREMSGGAVVPAGGELVLKPGGDHIMLTGVRTPLRPGEHFPMTLDFKSSGSRTIDVSVLAPDASGPGQRPQ
jgi:copper(I)-binding protein